jgi:hypothetical protein
VYNSTRQLGAVLGSAGMAAFMTWRIAAETPAQEPVAKNPAALQPPDLVRGPFSAAMSQCPGPIGFAHNGSHIDHER